MYKDTCDSDAKNPGQSKGIRVLPAFKIDTDAEEGTSGQSPLWSTGVTLDDASRMSAVLRETLIPLIWVGNALMAFPEEKQSFVIVENRTRALRTSEPTKRGKG